MSTHHHDKPGTVLLLALLVMSAVVTTSVGLSALILSSLKQTRTIDNAIVAYYAAESGAEEALYTLRRLDTLPPNQSTLTLENGAAWDRTVTSTEPVIYATIPKDSFIAIDLYNPEADTTATGIAKVTVQWTSGPSGTLTLTKVPWDASSPFSWDAMGAETYKYTGGSATISVDPSRLYKLRLRAENATFLDVQIRAFDIADAPKELPGRITISSLGRFITTNQRMSVTLPRRSPLSSIYDYVLFSECSLVKGGPITCP